MVLAAVKENGEALEYASNELKKDKEVVLAAVKKHGWALDYASKELQNDRDVVLAAVKENGYALRHASEELKNDEKVVLVAVRKDRDALKYASDELKNRITFENGKPIIKKKNIKNIKILEQANKILESDDKLSQQATNKNLISSVHLSLMFDPVTLRVRDSTNNRQLFHETSYFYDKDQVKHFNKKSPMSRRPIESVLENKQKKKEIMAFARKVIASRKQKKTSKK